MIHDSGPWAHTHKYRKPSFNWLGAFHLAGVIVFTLALTLPFAAIVAKALANMAALHATFPCGAC